MPVSSGPSGGPGGVITARTRLPSAFSASSIMSLAVAWRAAGSLSIALQMTSSRFGGSSGRCSVTSGGGSDRWAYMTAASEGFG